MRIKLVSWNVNGLRALSAKPEWEWFARTDAQIVALQETKAHPEQVKEELASPEAWEAHWSSSHVKKGYSGVAVFSRMTPLAVRADCPIPVAGEGRLLHPGISRLPFFNGYFPTAGPRSWMKTQQAHRTFKLRAYKMSFFEAFLNYAERVPQKQTIVVCGDFNIARRP